MVDPPHRFTRLCVLCLTCRRHTSIVCAATETSCHIPSRAFYFNLGGLTSNDNVSVITWIPPGCAASINAGTRPLYDRWVWGCSLASSPSRFSSINTGFKWLHRKLNSKAPLYTELIVRWCPRVFCLEDLFCKNKCALTVVF